MSASARALRLLAEVMLLTVASVVLGVVRQTAFPGAIPWVQDWSNFIESKARKEGLSLANLDDVRAIVDKQSHIVLDARPMADYDAGHLPGSLSLPQTAMEEHIGSILPLLSAEQPVLVYCSGKECDESFLLAVALRKQGFTNIVLFAGGFTEWRAAGLPFEGGKAAP